MRRGDLFVLSWESLRRVEWGKVSFALLLLLLSTPLHQRGSLRLHRWHSISISMSIELLFVRLVTVLGMCETSFVKALDSYARDSWFIP